MTKLFTKLLFFVLCCICFAYLGYAQDATPALVPTPTYKIAKDSFAKYPQEAIPLQRKGWKYRQGDDSTWREPTYNDSSWQFCSSTQFHFDSIAQNSWQGMGWFRLHFAVAAELKNTILEFNMRHYGASEIYLDGKLIQKFGTVAHVAEKEKNFYAPSVFVALPLDNADTHLLAIRYSNHKANLYRNRYGNAYPFAGFNAVLSADFQKKLDQRTVNYLSIFANFVLLAKKNYI